jgi:hypothetical protein
MNDFNVFDAEIPAQPESALRDSSVEVCRSAL